MSHSRQETSVYLCEIHLDSLILSSAGILLHGLVCIPIFLNSFLEWKVSLEQNIKTLSIEKNAAISAVLTQRLIFSQGLQNIADYWEVVCCVCKHLFSHCVLCLRLKSKPIKKKKRAREESALISVCRGSVVFVSQAILHRNLSLVKCVCCYCFLRSGKYRTWLHQAVWATIMQNSIVNKQSTVCELPKKTRCFFCIPLWHHQVHWSLSQVNASPSAFSFAGKAKRCFLDVHFYGWSLTQFCIWGEWKNWKMLPEAPTSIFDRDVTSPVLVSAPRVPLTLSPWSHVSWLIVERRKTRRSRAHALCPGLSRPSLMDSTAVFASVNRVRPRHTEYSEVCVRGAPTHQSAAATCVHWMATRHSPGRGMAAIIPALSESLQRSASLRLGLPAAVHSSLGSILDIRPACCRPFCLVLRVVLSTHVTLRPSGEIFPGIFENSAKQPSWHWQALKGEPRAKRRTTLFWLSRNGLWEGKSGARPGGVATAFHVRTNAATRWNQQVANVENGTRQKVCICFQHDFLLAVCPNLQLSPGGGSGSAFPQRRQQKLLFFLFFLAFEVLQLSQENILSIKVTRLHPWLKATRSSCESVWKLRAFYFFCCH